MMPLRAAALAPILAGIALAAAYPATAETPSPEVRNAEFAQLPYWDGFWLTENDETSIGGFSDAVLEARATGGANPVPDIMKLAGMTAPWSEEGRARQMARFQHAGGRKADGWGYPMMMNSAAPLQFLITPEEVLIINAYRDVRHVYTDGRDHPGEDDIWPTVWGDSVGHWEGDTLVIDTIAVKNPNIYFHSAPPFSEEAHYVERIRMVSPDKLESVMTIEDPVTLTKPWTVTLAWTRAEGFDRMIHDDYDNDRTDYSEGGGTILPPKDEQ